MADLPNDIARIDALTTNARNTWFALLGVLVFVGITLMSVEHIDFYGVDRATTLPLVNFDVPTRYFFVAAPILVAAIYGYFHLYLIRLWDALSVAEAQQGGQPLGDAITPWLVTDAALHMRARMRQDGCTTPRTIEGAAMLLNFALAWVFGNLVLGFLWWQSMPAREILMTSVAGIALSASLFVGAASFAMSVIRMRRKSDGKMVKMSSRTAVASVALITVLVIANTGHVRTIGNDPKMLAPITMIDKAIVERPKGWLPYQIAKAEHADAWCFRKKKNCAKLRQFDQKQLENDWEARRAAARSDLLRPYWSTRGYEKNMNWKNATLHSASLVGANLRNVEMSAADLRSANMEGAELSGGKLTSAFLFNAQLQSADLSGAQLASAVLIIAQLEAADLRGANMRGASLNFAKLQRADLSGSMIFGFENRISNLEQTHLFGATNIGGALRYADITSAQWDEETDFRYAFLDGSVKRTHAFQNRMGNPCQWVKVNLDKDEYFSVWRWWISQLDNIEWEFLSPREYREIPLPIPERLAELGLTDCEPNQPFGPMPNTD